ncbi:outer membrane immunogenic protein [Devosia sp. UYZn731]|uniref:outer membrane protein n=1 Tax=Devosia sp. UYZn731 TaxID=3156345 RepID=UPI0033954DC1
MPTRRLPLATLLAGVAALFSAAATQASDLGFSARMPVSSYSDAGLAIATDTWSGSYIGASIGGRTAGDLDLDFHDYGLTAGAQIGYLQQLGMFVLGAEVQGLWTDELHYALTPGAGLEQDWSIAAKGRAGVALGNLLIYGTGGAVFSELKPTGGASSQADWHTGAVFGGGVEHKLGDNLSLRAEYLQTRFFGVDSVAGVARDDDLVNHSVTAGLNYSF